jgi:hypothetical protein
MRASGLGCARLPTHACTATTGEVPAVRLQYERERLQPIPAPSPGTLQPARPARPAPLPHGYQHPLRVYEELITAVELG